MSANSQNFFSVGLGSKFTARPMLYIPSHLKRVATLSCEIQKIKNSKNLAYLTQSHQFPFNIHKIRTVKVSLCMLLSPINYFLFLGMNACMETYHKPLQFIIDMNISVVEPLLHFPQNFVLLLPGLRSETFEKPQVW